MTIKAPIHNSLSWKPVKAFLKRPIYLSLAALMEQDIAKGILPSGSKLPPQRELADYLGINFTTVTRTYRMCEQKGLIYAIAGSGTFISPSTDETVEVPEGNTLQETLEQSNKRVLRAMETQKKLLETSKQLIINNGYNNVTISEICAKCHVAKGTFYTYFDSKKDIVSRILADINRDMFNGKVWDEALSAKEQFNEYIDLYMQSIDTQGVDFARVFLTIIISKEYKEEMVASNLHEDTMYQIIDRGKKRGEFRRDMATETIYKYLRGFLFGIIMDWCYDYNKYSIVEQGGVAAKFFLDMISEE
ncbi:MAG: transcriptional regulator, TetR family [Lachnospiraceae bacterium]|jgi:DNA-binding transcriptional regulator YhcF (GntR family)|nr:transcriptional regulator, TetR family [Lachnospiraceae bacterium]